MWGKIRDRINQEIDEMIVLWKYDQAMFCYRIAVMSILLFLWIGAGVCVFVVAARLEENQ